MCPIVFGETEKEMPASIFCLYLRCQNGFIGPRCEYVDLDWRIGEKRQIIIACIIAGLVFLILLIVFICICSQ